MLSGLSVPDSKYKREVGRVDVRRRIGDDKNMLVGTPCGCMYIYEYDWDRRA